jgi:hypothetical protein
VQFSPSSGYLPPRPKYLSLHSFPELSQTLFVYVMMIMMMVCRIKNLCNIKVALLVLI